MAAVHARRPRDRRLVALVGLQAGDQVGALEGGDELVLRLEERHVEADAGQRVAHDHGCVRLARRALGSRRDRHLLVHHEAALEVVPQLAHVAGPASQANPIEEHVRGEAGQLARARSHAGQQRVHQEREVPLPLPERGEGDLQDREAKVEVRAKMTLVDLRAEIPVGRGDDPNVHREMFVGAHATDGLLLEDPQELRLQIAGQLADLVEEDRAPVRALEGADASAHRAREGALLVSEELALEEVRGQRGAVDDDEGALRAVALAVDGRGRSLLARAGFPFDQHGDVALGAAREGVEHAAHRDRAAHHAAEALGVHERELPSLLGELEAEPHLAETDLAARLQPRGHDPHAVDEGAVAAPHVVDPHALRGGQELAVEARHGGLVDHERVREV